MTKKCREKLWILNKNDDFFLIHIFMWKSEVSTFNAFKVMSLPFEGFFFWKKNLLREKKTHFPFEEFVEICFSSSKFIVWLPNSVALMTSKKRFFIVVISLCHSVVKWRYFFCSAQQSNWMWHEEGAFDI